ncbi:MAG: acetate kinase [Acidobacteriota bacterium]
MKILVLNCGSSSVKFALVETGDAGLLARGLAEPIGAAAGSVSWETRGRFRTTAALPDHSEAIRIALDCLLDPDRGAIRTLAEIEGVGHRMVHGGEHFSGSVAIDEAVLRAIEECAALAPLHNPHNLSGYRASRRLLPAAAQVAVFDTAFHQTLPARAYTYALPHELCARHKLRRYGFHGTSHRYVVQRFAEIQGGAPAAYRLITCHLGNGCSMTAVDRGRSVDTSLGFTPLEGLVMGTRSGDADPGMLLQLMEWEQLSPGRMLSLLNKESGLLGISGISNDMRIVLEHAGGGNERARLAVEVFCYRIRKYIGAYFAVLNGADAVVFTGGIGENAPEIRARACESLEALGIRIDPAKNAAAVGAEMDISADGGATRVWVIPTNEELLIARDTAWCIEESK